MTTTRAPLLRLAAAFLALGAALAACKSPRPPPPPPPPPATEVAVPGVVGLTRAQAEADLAAAHLSLGAISEASSDTLEAGRVLLQTPGAGARVAPGTAVALVISTGPASVLVPAVVGLTRTAAAAALEAAGLILGAVVESPSDAVPAGQVSSQLPPAGALAPPGSAVDLTVSSGPSSPPPLPPDPGTVAPALDPTLSPSTRDAVGFLYAGADPIQTGVSPGAIDLQRAAVLRGRVLDRGGAPISGATVRIVGRPELGQTLTRADGGYDLAVNGGGTLTFALEKAGLLPVERQAEVGWQRWVVADDVVMIPLDPAVTAVELSAAAPAQVARGSPVVDADGARQATLLFAPGTSATVDGVPVASLAVRATEYTVGDTGPAAMPAPLPPTSGYTYAVELSADEAPGRSVAFSKPVMQYLENFLGFPVGVHVPAGWYDRSRSAWIPSDDGRVIRVLAATGGLAEVDADGDGVADGADALAALGFTEVERQQLAGLYAAGQTLWRIPVSHFTPWDYNFPYGPPPGAVPPTNPPPRVHEPDPDDCPTPGSLIGCQSQSLGESLPVTGSPGRLHYASDRAPGYLGAYTVTIPLSGATVPGVLRGIALEISIAGRRFLHSFPPGAAQSFTFTWDGRDAYGRALPGAQVAAIRVGYSYELVYYSSPTPFTQSFGATAGIPMAVSRPTRMMTLWQDMPAAALGQLDVRAAGLGGWTLTPHHHYDPAFGKLYRGDGSRDDRAFSTAIRSVLGEGVQECGSPDTTIAAQVILAAPAAVSHAPDGTLVWADRLGNWVCRMAPDGAVSAVAGIGLFGFSGDGGPAARARLGQPEGVAVAGDGTIFIADTRNHRVRRVGADGSIVTVAGSGNLPGWEGDGGPATQARLTFPTSVAVTADGTLYIAETSAARIRRVSPGGIIYPVAGDNTLGCAGDGGPALQASLGSPRGLAVSPDGSLYFADCGRVRRIGPDGVITTVVGGGPAGATGDGIPATQAQLSQPAAVALAPDGTLYVAEEGGHRIRRVGGGGILTTAAGTGVGSLSGDGGPPALAALNAPRGVAVAPDGALLVADTGNRRIRRIARTLPGLGESEVLLASRSGTEIFVFSAQGRHLRTLDAWTGAVRRSFAYDSGGRLASMSDGSGNLTAVERDGAGAPVAIVAPGGQRTALSLDANGWLARVTNPAGEAHALTSGTTGLLESRVDPGGGAHAYRYDAAGLLVEDAGPAGGVKSLARTADAGGRTVTVTHPGGATTSYRTEVLAAGGRRRINSDDLGASSEVVVDPDGTRHVAFADGQRDTYQLGPDPRFGMQVPRVVRRVRARPGGQTEITAVERTVTLQDPRDPTRLATLAETVVVNGRTFTRSYDGATRTLTDTSAEGNVRTTRLDGQGRVVEAVPGTGLTPLTATYGAAGRLSELRRGALFWSYGYDARGRLVERSDGSGRRIQLGYDDADRLVRKTFPSGAAYAFSHDAAGNRTAVTLPGGTSHGLAYSVAGLRSRYTPPGGGDYQWSHDGARRLVLSTLPGGRTTSQSYDAQGRVVGLACGEATTTFEYADGDATDRVARIAWAPATGVGQDLALAYDGELISGATATGLSPWQATYLHDDDLFLSGTSLTSGTTTVVSDWTHDRDGLLTGLGPFQTARTGPGRAPGSISDGALDASYGWDALRRPTGRAQQVAAASTFSYALTYGADGRIAARTETRAGVTQAVAFAYDADGQLVEVRRGGVVSEQYAYDAKGNRTSRTLGGGPPEAASHDVEERLTQRGEVGYRFDADGFLAQRGDDTFQHAATGQLLQASVAGGSIRYGYDGLGRRVSRTDSAGTTRYLYGDPAGHRLSALADPSGALTFLWYDTLGHLVALDRGGARYYVATDPVGSPRVVSDAAGAPVRVLDYDAFGAVLSDSNPAFDLPIGFAGGLADAATGLVHFAYRDYEPASGRFTSRDPALFAGRQGNLYAYARNDPVDLRDPTGLFCVAASAYEGVGGGFSLCITEDGASVCGELGLGFGAEAGVNLGGLEETGADLVMEVSLSAGGVEAQASVTLDGSGCLKGGAKGRLGPVTFDSDKGVGLEVPEFGLEAEAKVAGKVCYQHRF